MAAPSALPHAAPPDARRAGDCPRCGAAHDALQEYCLECGQRLPHAPGVGEALATAWGRRTAWYAGDWVWPATAALVVAVLAAVAVIAVRAAEDDSAQAILTATEPAIAPPLTAAERAGSETVPEAALRATLPELSETEPVPTQAPPPRRREVTTWPRGTDGFTVVLASVPDGARPAAAARAREASAAGLTEVGVLRSSEYSSLHPGYLVVFSGVYATRAEAEAAIENARVKGYNDAYAAQVAR